MANAQHPRMHQRNNKGRRMLSYADPTTGQTLMVAEGTPLPAGACPVIVADDNQTQQCLENNPANCSALSAWRQYVEGSFCVFPPGIRDKIEARSLIWLPGSLFSSRAVLPTTEFFQSDDAKVTGIRNIEKMKLDADRLFVCFGIRLGSAIGTDLGTLDYFALKDTPPATTGPNVLTSSLDPVIKNGELLISLDGKEIIKEIPGNNFNQIYAEKTGYWELPVPLVIPPQKDLKVDLKLPTGVTIPTNLAAHIELIGLITRPNYMAA